MKGKGKGDRGSKQHDECPLQFPGMKLVDHTRLCPRYTAVLGRSREVDCVGVEEVDSLQTELETLLAAAAKRMRLLQSEIEILDDWIDKGSSVSAASSGAGISGNAISGVAGSKERSAASALSGMSSSGQQNNSETSSTSASVAPSVPSSGKRGGKGKTEDKPAKRMRTDSGRATYAQPSPTKSKGKVQHSKTPSDIGDSNLPSESPRSGSDQSTMPASATTGPVRSVYKNLTPNRFWALVEPYCAEITPDDIKYLEEQLKACEDIGEYMKIPSLGRHYSEKWADEDLNAEREGGKLTDRRKSATNASQSNGAGDAASLLKRVEDSADDDTSSPFGPLTQRLIQGLLEENVTPLDEDNEISDADAMEAASISPRSLAKQLHLGNTATLERRIKRELEEIGILGVDDDKAEEAGGGGGDDEDDEILAELRKKQAELRAVSHQNTMMLRHLYKQAKEELVSQELRRKMAAADAEVIEAYRKVQASKTKKKSPTKKEKDMFYKALKDRDLIVKQLHRTESQ